jgi:iron-sulfur cluster repair protein YtfE (RIC family)
LVIKGLNGLKIAQIFCMNAIDYLLLEHENHRRQLKQIDQDKSIYSSFRHELIHHVNMEEKVLYPNLLRIEQLQKVVREAWEEHTVCMQLVQELDEIRIDSKEWDAKFSTLKKILLLHLTEEEERLFPQIRQLATEEFLSEVGKQMKIQKKYTPTEEIIYPHH